MGPLGGGGTRAWEMHTETDWLEAIWEQGDENEKDEGRWTSEMAEQRKGCKKAELRGQ